MENVAYNQVRIILGQDIKKLTKPLGTSEVTSKDELFTAYCNRLGWTITSPQTDHSGEPVFYCFNLDEEQQEMRQLVSAFNDFNSTEAIGITQKPTEFSLQEDEDLQRMELNIR